jgi:hypothetical protein
MAFGAGPCGLRRFDDVSIRRAGDRVIRRPTIWGYGDSVIG